MMNQHDVILLNERFCQFLGTAEVESSKYPVELFMDVTAEDNLTIQVEDKMWGYYRYPLKNIKSVALVQPHIRQAIRAYEDYVIARYENMEELNAPETAFLNNWLLS